MMRLPLPARLIAGPALCGLLLAGLAARPVAAQTPPAPSPEELAIGLLPYQLTTAELPAGYQVAGAIAITPALLAYNDSNSASEGQSALHDVADEGILTGIEQVIGPKPATPLTTYDFTVRLFDTADNASTFMHDVLDTSSGDGLQVDVETLPTTYGDESGGLHVVVTMQDGTTTGLEEVYWRRGRLLFRMVENVPDRSEAFDQVIPFVQAADAHAAPLTPPAPPSQATLPVTSSESVRVAATYALADRLPGDSLTPYGLQIEDPNVITNADLLLDKSDAKSAYTALISNTGRIVGVERDYDTLQGPGNDQIAVQYVLSATPQGAQAELENPFEGDTTVSVANKYSLPTPLGDNSVLLEGTVTFKDGPTVGMLAAVWTRGNVTLKVIALTPSGDITPDQLVAFATQVDGVYTHGTLPAVLSNPNGAATAPAASPTAPTNPVQASLPAEMLLTLHQALVR